MTAAIDEPRFCACGCGTPIAGLYNSNTKEVARFARGHWIRVAANQDQVGGKASARRRAGWPSKMELAALLAPPGNVSSAARALHRAKHTVRNMIRVYGLEYEPHANSTDPSHVSFGWAGEEHAALVLGADVHRRSGRPGQEPFDLVWRGRRVEVKSARPTYAGRPAVLGWTFSIAKSRGKHDLLFLIACAPDGMPVRYFMVPPEAEPGSTIRIGVTLRGKWMKYEWRPLTS